jgi:putative nucleotidyltransferase with HDIG domain
VGGLVLLLSTAAPAPLLRRVGPLLAFEALAIAGLFALGGCALVYPDIVPQVPVPNSFSALALLALGLMVFALLAFRALRTFLLTRRVADLAVVVGLVWLVTALVPALTMTYDELGWWIGHEVELVGAEEEFLGSNVRALTRRLAEKDEYTERHARRVALLAVQVGELLGLSSGRLRALAIGGLVHDIGKLSTPDAILKKPGPLDDREFAVIRRHPTAGARLLQELGGFPKAVRTLVRDHHERLDGSGYPRGLGEDELDLKTRILSVCDVYDALMSPRVYRPAWTHAYAVVLLRRKSGTAFDPRCVAALEQVLLREWATTGPRATEHPASRRSARTAT